MSEEEELNLPMGYDVDGRWKIKKKLGQGAFGAVYEIVDVQNKVKGAKALKLESVGCRDQVLKVEVMVLRMLVKSNHFCRLHACGRNDRFNFVVMSLVGPSLSTLRKKATATKFSKETTLYVTAHSLQAIKDMHGAGWLHRDIKPSNFAMGYEPDKKRIVHILDFGLSRTYKTQKGGIRAPREVAGFRGTLRYCSLNAHKGKELGRADDLISLLYMMVEMFTSTTPWKQLDINNEVKTCKEKTASTLYAGLTPQFNQLHQYLHTLTYFDSPKYELFENTIHTVIGRNQLNALQLDWEGGFLRRRKTPSAAESAYTEPANLTNLNTKQGAEQAEADLFSGVEDLPQTKYRELLKKKPPPP